jgi:hypothetical protein
LKWLWLEDDKDIDNVWMQVYTKVNSKFVIKKHGWFWNLRFIYFKIKITSDLKIYFGIMEYIHLYYNFCISKVYGIHSYSCYGIQVKILQTLSQFNESLYWELVKSKYKEPSAQKGDFLPLSLASCLPSKARLSNTKYMYSIFLYM